LFGSGILYLSVRHSVDDPPMLLVHVAALTVVAGIASTVGLLGRLLVEPKRRPAPRWDAVASSAAFNLK
jgi:hypothetical protein